jgi:hypothetical protein
MALSVQIVLNFPCSDAEIEEVLKIHAFMSKRGQTMDIPVPSDNGVETLGEPLNDDEKSQLDKSSWRTHEENFTPLMDSLELEAVSKKVSIPSLMMSILHENGGKVSKDHLFEQVSKAFPDLPAQKIQSRLASAAKAKGIKKANALFCEEWFCKSK